MNNNQLTNYNTFDAKRLIFTKPEVGNIPGAVSKLTFKRIRIAIKNPDGSIGDLIMATPPDLLCYGLQEQTDPSNGVVNGYQFPMVLWNRNDPTSDEKAFTDAIHQISDACKEHLIKNKEEIEKYDLEMNDLKKFNPLYYKMEKGKVVEGKGPMLYIKTMTSKKAEGIKINTVFTDAATNEYINPMDLMNKRCYVQGAIKIESIFVGNKISLQVKLFESRVKVVDTAFRSLLNPSVVINVSANKPAADEDEEEEDVTPKVPLLPVIHPQAGFTETGSIADEEEEDDEDEEEEEEDEEEQPPAKTETTPPAEIKTPIEPAKTEAKKRGPAKKK